MPLLPVAARPLHRRHFLRGAGAVLSLPLLEAMTGSLAKADQGKAPKRTVAFCATLGFHGPALYPEQAGRDYQLTPYLEELKDHRNDLTVISGLSHPEQQGNNGHASELTWLTSAQRPGLAGFKNTISIDQLIANQIGLETRFPYLALSSNGRSMSWTSTGVEIPGEGSPSRVFNALFVRGTDAEVAKETRRLTRGRSILDTVNDDAQRLHSTLGQQDRYKLDEYLAAVRDLELRLQQTQGWAKQPKPKVDAEPPTDITNRNDAIGRQKLLSDMIVLALQTDSTRTITFQLSGLNSVPEIPGVQNDWHNLSHHGKDPAKIEELKIVEAAEFAAFGEFLGKLKAVKEYDGNLLDNTAVLFGSNLGNASAHDWHNVPVVLAGGGYRHGAHLAHDPKNNKPLANLFVSLAQRVGVEIDSFGSSDSAGINGLELG
ncbi:DUF1552 domain-containing protein [Lignipirellula cremea]|uniref:DUF1552 domain-containing protein n=1 Tax=Lignipirellula cremea TaxID=2528010 RepID=A0A518DX06_9BACT|nr:DUF1552 domain-containing protein [Lignipirellula cremea]QDU96367.1 hypothetical protein Pla8534_41870 [Lignipirellula cremea]